MSMIQRRFNGLMDKIAHLEAQLTALSRENTALTLRCEELEADIERAKRRKGRKARGHSEDTNDAKA